MPFTFPFSLPSLPRFPSPMRRVYAFILKRVLGEFLINPDGDGTWGTASGLGKGTGIGQLDVQWGKGMIQLQNLNVNVEVSSDAAVSPNDQSIANCRTRMTFADRVRILVRFRLFRSSTAVSLAFQLHFFLFTFVLSAFTSPGLGYSRVQQRSRLTAFTLWRLQRNRHSRERTHLPLSQKIVSRMAMQIETRSTVVCFLYLCVP